MRRTGVVCGGTDAAQQTVDKSEPDVGRVEADT